MRTPGPAFTAHVASGATTLATCWRIARLDGLVLGFTDHDAALSFGGTDYVPAHGLDGGEAAHKLGPQTDTAEVVGVLHSDAIAEADILLGRYDGASVETWRVNWRDVSIRHLVRRATIGEIVRADGVFRAELRSAQQALNQPKGRIYQALCDASLGDARCGVDLDDPAYRAALSMVPLLGAILVLRALGRRGTRFERALFALFLAAMPTIYVGSCLREGSGPWLWVEIGGLVLYAGLAILGLLRTPWFLAAGIAGHGLFWDSWHYALTSYIPRWYVVGCLVVDLGFAAYAAAQVRHWRSRSRS